MAFRRGQFKGHDDEDERDNSLIEIGLKKIFASKKYVDCKFLVGPNRAPFEAHRLVLAMASGVFEKLLYSQSHTPDEPILVPDLNPIVFEKMLRYIYLQESPFKDLDNLTITELWYATCKYGLQKLNKECYNKIKLNMASWFHVYRWSKILLDDGHQDSDVNTIFSRSLKLFSVKTTESVCAFENYKLMAPFLKDLLALEHMNIDSELDLFLVLVKYANIHGWKPDNQYLLEKGENGVELLTPFQKDIREAMKQIRFLRMTLKSFDSIPSKSGFLTEFEVQTIRNRIADENSACVSGAGFSKNTAERYTLIHIGSTKIIQDDKNKEVDKLEFSIEFPDTTLAVTEPITVGNATFRIIIYQRKSRFNQTEYTVYLKCLVPETQNWKCYAQLDIYIDIHGHKVFENAPWYCFKCDANYSQTKPFKFGDPVKTCNIELAVSPHHKSYKNKMSNVTATYGDDLQDFV